MHVTLVHNTSAGDRRTDAAALERTIEAAGHRVRVVAGDEPDWPRCLEAPADLIAVSGGDGTIARVAKALVGRDVPIALLPAGTANNIARTLGLEPKDAAEHVARWPTSLRVRVDVGVATGPWGTERLIEGLGCGLFSSSIEIADTATSRDSDLEGRERVARALDVLAQRAGALPATHLVATIDGRDISGRYLVVEAMNTRFIGPNLFLAPTADPGDGLLDVVLVSDEERQELIERLAAWRRGSGEVPALRVERGRSFEMQWSGFDLHYDDATWSGAKASGSDAQRVAFALDGAAVWFLLP